MEKKIKPNVKRIVEALTVWSPKGLCSDTLVEENGSKKKTQACAIGCLALDYAYSKEGTAFFKRKGVDRKRFIKGELYGSAFISGDFAYAVRDYYGIDETIENAIMGYNDSCIDSKGKPVREEQKALSPTVRKTIYSLRKRYQKWLDEKYGSEE